MNADTVDQSLQGNQDTSPESSGSNDNINSQSSNNQIAESQAAYELEKLGKFKFQGQEWTARDLEKAILRQQDYTKKTQGLSEERKSFDSERKYYENLAWDLDAVKNNPSLAQKFVEAYPAKFHSYLKEVLNVTNQSQASQSQQPRASNPIDVDTMATIHELKSYVNEQQVAKNTAEINSTLETMSKKYPNAIPELALSKVFAAHSQGQKVTPELWEKYFKQVDDQMNQNYKARYSQMVKTQSEANKKAQDVDAGGGTPGKAPQKFKNLSEVTKYAAGELGRKS